MQKLVRVEQPPIVHITTLELRRGHLDLKLLKKTVPDDAPWWAQLDYNAQKGLVVRRHWNDRLQTYVELLGTMKQKDAGSWRWEKAEDSRVRRLAYGRLSVLIDLYRAIRGLKRSSRRGRSYSESELCEHGAGAIMQA